MITFDALQQSLIDADHKVVAWLFDVNNQYINFDNYAGTRKWQAGDAVIGASSGATATIERVVWTSSTAGKLMLSSITGTFTDDEIIYVASYESELVTNGNFANWTGDDPDNWTVTEVGDATSNITESAGACQIISDGTLASIVQACLTASTYVKIALDVDTVTSGKIVVKVDDTDESNELSTTGSKTLILDATRTTLEIKRESGGCNIVIDDVSVKQIKTAALANGTQQGDEYYWSTGDWSDDTGETLYFEEDKLFFGTEEITFGPTQEYSFKIVPNSFRGVEIHSPLSQFNTYTPNEIEFEVINTSNSLTPSDFEDAEVHLKLIFSFGSGLAAAVMREWKYVVEQSHGLYERITIVAKDFVSRDLKGYYPNGNLVDDIFSPYDDDLLDNSGEQYCVPVPFGTAYIPLKPISDSAYQKGYFLGSDDYTYTVAEVTSPRSFGALSSWANTDATFRTTTKTDRWSGQDWYILYPFLLYMDEKTYSGTHDGGDNQSTLSDSTKSWTNDELIGMRVVNDTTSESAYITDNDGTTVTGTLSGDDWDDDDEYHIEASGLWKGTDGFFKPILTKFTRSDTSSTTSPADVIEFVLGDMGIKSGNIDSTVTFSTADTTYTAWGLTFNGGFYFKQEREKVLAQLLNSCHSTIDVTDKVELRVISKTSQMTIDNSDVIRNRYSTSYGSFNYNYILPSEYDSGYVAFTESGNPQDVFLKLRVPSKSATNKPSDEILEIPFITDSQDAQSLGTLYYQRKYEREANISFTSKTRTLPLQPNDVITINHNNYGGSYAAVIESMMINRNGSITINAVKYKVTLDDFTDISPSAVSSGSNSNDQYWSQIPSGPTNVDTGSGDAPHLIPGHLRVGDGSNYVYIDRTYPFIGLYVSDVTKVRIGNLNGFLGNVTDLYGIAIGETNKSLQYDPTNGLVITGPGITAGSLQSSDWAAAAGVKLDLANKYLKMGGSNVTAGGAAAGIFLGLDTSYKLYIGDGSNEYFKYDGTNVSISTALSNAIQILSGGSIKINDGGDIVLEGADSDNCRIYHVGSSYSNYTTLNAAGTLYVIRSDTTNVTTLKLGTATYKYDDIEIHANSTVITEGVVRPSADSTDNLGTTNFCWLEVYADAGITGCSDRKWKINVKPTPFGLDFVNKLDFIEWEFDSSKGKHRKGKFHGVLAQDVLSIMEEMGYTNKDFAGIRVEKTEDGSGENWGFVYEQLIAPIGKGLQEEDMKVESALSRITALENEISLLKE